MSIVWLAPIAFLGIGLALLPIAIHLLVRQQSRQVAYPSLRFLRQSQLAAFRPRTVQNAALLACRILIVCAAALALAGPVLQTPARTAGYASRVARAVILEPGRDLSPIPVSAVEEAARDAFVSEIFSRSDIADAIADALRWLDRQPPAAREVTFVATFRRGQLDEGHLLAIPESTGIRFVPVSRPASTRDLTIPVLVRQEGALSLVNRVVHLGDDTTKVTDGARVAVPDGLVSILASPGNQRLADAALRAALGAGIRWSDASARVLVAWPAADDEAVRRESNGATLVRMDVPVPASSTASAVSEAITRRIAPSLDGLEPARIPAGQLAAWSRPPGAPPPAAAPIDEGDRRWLWALVLILLGLEHWLRRRSAPESFGVIDASTEARVA